ncbi:MAG TPA: cytochrome-c peroxidase, partial [Myxococcales bacterium]|nr:cytochrome-c peroxidase [Myxococcales bacterium]
MPQPSLVGLAAALAFAAGGVDLEAVPHLDDATETPLYTYSLPPGGAGTPEQAALGAKLFYDVRLSSDASVDCDSCHLTYQGFADFGQSVGVRRQLVRRNAPTLFDAMFNARQFWDGRAASLEEQARGPLLSPFEMGNRSPQELEARLAAIPEYRAAFPRVFGRPVAFDDAITAITAFERRQIGLDSPFDRFVAGDDGALSASAKRGW